MEQLTQQVLMLTQRIADQDGRLNQMRTTRFELTADQIIRNFNDIQPFSGEDSYKLKSFLKAVDDAESLCGENNGPLRQYCLRIVNSKIIGKARNAILEIPENLRTWQTVVDTLKQRFRPKRTVHQLLYQAKELKVYNLKDLFNKLSGIKSETSEICDFVNENNFTYESIDKELVYILKSKLIPTVQMQIDQTKTLFELENVLCQTEIYLTDEAIKTVFKIDKNQKSDKGAQSYKRNDNNFQTPKRNHFNEFQNYNRNYSNNDPQTYKRNNNDIKDYKGNNQYNSQQYNSKQYNPQQYNSKQYNPQNTYNSQRNRQNYYRNNSEQYRPGQQPRSENNRSEPMEVENIHAQNEIEQEVNFTDWPQRTNYL